MNKGPLVLPSDVIIVPAREFNQAANSLVEHKENEWAVICPRILAGVWLIDADSAILLREFRACKTIARGIVDFSKARGLDIQRIADVAQRVLERFVQAKLLVPVPTEYRGPSLAVGERFLGYELVSWMQGLAGAERYLVRTENADFAILDIVRSGDALHARRTLRHEAKILALLGGDPSAPLHALGTFQERFYLVKQWFPGVPASIATDEYRTLAASERRWRLEELGGAIAEAYARLHAKGVIHCAVHPSNVLVAADGRVQLIDFSLAHIGIKKHRQRLNHQAPSPFEAPEIVSARQNRQQLPPLTFLSEQYSLAALLWQICTAGEGHDFALTESEAAQRAPEGVTRSTSRGESCLGPRGRRLLSKALSTNPSERFESVADFANALAQARPPRKRLGCCRRDDLAEARMMLSGTLERLHPRGALFPGGVSTVPLCSLMRGAAGIAYALYRIAIVREEPELLDQARLWATRAVNMLGHEDAVFDEGMGITEELVGRISPYHTAAGIFAVRTLIAQATGDSATQKESLARFIEASRASCGSIDLTFGRSGSLIACTLLLDAIEGTSGDARDSRSQILDLGEKVAEHISRRVSALPEVVDCEQPAYIGMAHGWAGLCYAALAWSEASGAPVPPWLGIRLDEIAQLAEPIGRGLRWRMRPQLHYRHLAEDYMTSWCHGSPGLVHLWTAAYSHYGKPEFLELAEQSAWHTWEGPGSVGSVCCGYAGRSYALVNLYKYVGDPLWLTRACNLANRAALSCQDSSESLISLYRGDLGVALLAAELEKPGRACHPFFERDRRAAD